MNLQTIKLPKFFKAALHLFDPPKSPLIRGTLNLPPLIKGGRGDQ
jgi:hypothetical protein